MTPAAKITYSCFLLIGFLIGLFFGFRYMVELLPDYELGKEMTVSQSVDEFGRIQFRHAKPDEAEKSLELCRAILEELRQRSPGVPEQTSLADTYVRLALLADHKGNDEQSRAYMAKAQQSYNSLLLARPVSDAQLKAALTLRDSIRDP